MYVQTDSYTFHAFYTLPKSSKQIFNLVLTLQLYLRIETPCGKSVEFVPHVKKIYYFLNMWDCVPNRIVVKSHKLQTQAGRQVGGRSSTICSYFSRIKNLPVQDRRKQPIRRDDIRSIAFSELLSYLRC